MKQQIRINEIDASMTIHEVSDLARISVRTLRYYDKIGLLKPSARTDAGYRLYGRSDLARLQQILLFRELEFPLKEIRAMIESPRYDQESALDQQIELLQLKREHLENLIAFAKDLKANAGAASAQQTMQRASKVATKEKSRGSVIDDSRGATTAAVQNGTPINTRSEGVMGRLRRMEGVRGEKRGPHVGGRAFSGRTADEPVRPVRGNGGGRR